MNNESYSGGDLHNIIGRVAVYAQVGLVMLFGVYLLWAFMGGLDAQLILMRHPELATEYEALLKGKISGDELFMKTLMLIAPHMHWFYLAVASSLVAYPCLGWLLGRMLDCPPTWAGLLPILGLLSGFNPAFIGASDFIATLSLEESIAVLTVQIVCIQGAAAFTFERRQAALAQEASQEGKNS